MTKGALIPLGRNSPHLKIDEIAITELKRPARSLRIHPEKQIVMLSRNIDTLGFLVPCLIDEQNRLLSGSARVLAAERLGIRMVPVIRIGHLTEIEKRAFRVADNKLTEMAIWDLDILRSELQFFTDLNIDFDFSALGFETAEVDLLLESGSDDADDDRSTFMAPNQHAISGAGDLWKAGPHRVYCGDALVPASYEASLDGQAARLVITDPPYNVPIKGHVVTAGGVQHREFAMAVGEMGSEQFTSFLIQTMKNLATYSVDGSLHYLCMDWRHCHEILTAGNAVYSELKNICVWRKTNAGMGSLYRSQHEFVFVFKNGSAPHINNVDLGVYGRLRSNVWDYAGMNSFGKDRDELLAMHPTVKPVALVADIIKDASARGDLVLDAFGGSGSTLVAAEKTNRRSALIEIDPLYVDGMLRRWQAFTGKEAVCARTGATFAQREAARAARAATAEDGARS
jgi:DNA modification methylase